jgi:hypothetical protein
MFQVPTVAWRVCRGQLADLTPGKAATSSATSRKNPRACSGVYPCAIGSTETGNLRKSIALVTLNIAAVHPLPIDRVSAAVAVKSGWRARPRRPNRRSLRRSSS